MKAWGLILMFVAVATVAPEPAPLAAQAPGTSGRVAQVTFSKDVLPILQKSCQSCHRPGEVAPFSLMDYQSARPYARAIKKAVASRQMPPWFAEDGFTTYSN